SSTACFNHFLQIFLCQFDVCDPLEFMDFFLPVFFCFIPIAVHIRFFFLPCRFLYMVDIFSVPAFFPDSRQRLCSASTGNPFIALCQHFLPCCLLGQDVFPVTAHLHDRLCRIKGIPLQTD